MKKVIVLGAGRGQIPIIDLFHKYDCFVIVVTPKGDYPGIELADKVVYIDVRAREEVLKLAIEENIVAITTDQLDEGVLTAVYVSEKLGLVCIGSEIAERFTNKYIMRQYAKRLGISVPKNICVNNKAMAMQKMLDLKYPVMIKPADSSASRGVYKISSQKELWEKFDESMGFSKIGEVIIEEFIKGQEFVVDAYTHQGKTRNLIVGHRDYFSIKDSFIPNATIFLDAESANNDIQTRIQKINVQLVQGFGLPFGITHAEYLYNVEEDKIYLVEIAARGGGVFISSDLIPMACGVNANDLLVKEVLGLITPKDDFVLKRGAAAYFCYLLPRGEVITLQGTERVLEIKNVEKAFFDNIQVGLQVHSIKDKSSRKGPILIKADSIQECYDTIEKVKSVLNIEVKTEEGIKSAIWN